MKKSLVVLLLSFSSIISCSSILLACENENGWFTLFNGKNLDGWKAVENPDSVYVEDGMLTADGPRAHLFYVGPVLDADFKNFIFRADVKTLPGTNSGIFFHTEYEKASSPHKGYEVQINNSMPREKIKTGSLYRIKNVYESEVKDNVWFTMEITVTGKHVVVKADGKTIMDYTEPEDHVPPRSHPKRYISNGTFALQFHDPNSKVFFKNIKVKPLPDPEN